MRNNNSREERQKKIRELKPKRQQKLEQDKEFEQDLKLLMKLRQQRTKLQRDNRQKGEKIQQKGQLLGLAKSIQKLQRSVVDVSMMEEIMKDDYHIIVSDNESENMNENSEVQRMGESEITSELANELGRNVVHNHINRIPYGSNFTIVNVRIRFIDSSGDTSFQVSSQQSDFDNEQQVAFFRRSTQPDFIRESNGGRLESSLSTSNPIGRNNQQGMNLSQDLQRDNNQGQSSSQQNSQSHNNYFDHYYSRK